MLEPPYSQLDDLLELMGEAGRRLSEIDAAEGAAGNISVCIRWPVDPRTRFRLAERIDLPQRVPELAEATFLVTGSGRRLREIIEQPVANVGCLVVDEGGSRDLAYLLMKSAPSAPPSISSKLFSRGLSL